MVSGLYSEYTGNGEATVTELGGMLLNGNQISMVLVGNIFWG